MCTEQESGKTESLLRGLRIEPVDNWHAQWGNVLAEIELAGQRQALSIDLDGWLSARQVLLVAFNETQVAGHICFGITPISDEGGQVIVQAHLDAFGVKPGFETLEIGPALKQAAQQRAEALKCSRFIGF
jgi:predicted N-acetyltransferase YhbS